jgi:hypothetical protein
VKKRKAKKKATRRRRAVVLDIDRMTDELMTGVETVKLKRGEVLPLFEVAMSDKGELLCLVRALIDPLPHQFGHILGEVLRTHAKVYAKTFGLDQATTVAAILDGLVHELSGMLTVVQKATFEEEEAQLSRADPIHSPNRPRKIH